MSTILSSPLTKQLIATTVDLSNAVRSKSKEKSSLFEKFSKFFATPHKKEEEPALLQKFRKQRMSGYPRNL